MSELKSVQKKVDDWIKNLDYFNEMTNLSNLT